MAFEQYNQDLRDYAIKEYLTGQRSQQSICRELGIGQATLSRWIKSHYKKAALAKENKEGFVQELSEVLQTYSRRKLRYIEYIADENGTETLRICFEEEPDKSVNVTGEPCIGIMGIIAHILR